MTVPEAVSKLKSIIKEALEMDSPSSSFVTTIVQKVGPGSLLVNAAGFPNSSFIPHIKRLKTNVLYRGCVNRSGRKMEFLLCVIEREGKITTEVLFDNNEKAEPHEVLLIEKIPLMKLEPFEISANKADAKITFELMIQCAQLRKALSGCTCKSKNLKKKTKKELQTRQQIVMALRRTLLCDLEMMALVDWQDKTEKVSLAKSKPGSDIMNSAGFKNSVFIAGVKQETDLEAGFVYAGVVHRGGDRILALMGILDYNSVEVMLENDMEILPTDVAEFSPQPLR
eukprot:UN25465